MSRDASKSHIVSCRAPYKEKPRYQCRGNFSPANARGFFFVAALAIVASWQRRQWSERCRERYAMACRYRCYSGCSWLARHMPSCRDADHIGDAGYAVSARLAPADVIVPLSESRRVGTPCRPIDMAAVQVSRLLAI
jgi:hypothetical protein